jgi:hypothetical protein
MELNASEIAELVFAKIYERGLPPKVLLTPKEAAESLGFTESAFNQAPWMKELPVVKIGIQNRYLPEDLKTFAADHRIKRLQKH